MVAAWPSRTALLGELNSRLLEPHRNKSLFFSSALHGLDLLVNMPQEARGRGWYISLNARLLA